MSSPAAAFPVAVLVLAWDETTPAARVLVEPADFAEPALGSVAVLVPTGPATAELTTEEYLPLASSLELLAPELPAEAATTADSDPAAAAGAPQASLSENSRPEDEETAPSGELPAPATEVIKEAPATTEAAGTNPPPAITEAATPPLPIATATALVGPALVWQQVRVLQFASATLVEPTLVWEGAGAAPAAPYLGSSALAPAAPEALEAGRSAVAAAYLAGAGSPAAALSALRGPALPGRGPAPAFNGLLASSITPYLTVELPAAPNAEADAMPAPSPAGPLLTDASTTELSEEAAAPAEPFSVDVSAVQAEPAQPAAPPAAPVATAPPAAASPLSPAPEPGAPYHLDALHPAGRPFDAPDLNFQIIQYARRAVPQALAAQPFGVIYAPAWPTWLAAQELRQRTGQPLVLHLAQLAAADDEHLDLAAGWVAEIQRQALHRADLILTETTALAQRLRHELALPAHRVRAVPAADAAAVARALGGVERG